MADKTFKQRVREASGIIINNDNTSSGQVDNYNAAGADAVIFSGAVTKLTGFSGGADGAVIEVGSSSQRFILSSFDAGSSSGNQLITRNIGNRVVYPGETVRFVYFAVYNAWLEVSKDIEISDSFSPAAIADLNVTNTSVNGIRHIRFGDEVRVVGTINCEPVAAGKCQIGIPLTSGNMTPDTITDAFDITGTACADDGTAIIPAQFLADVANSRAQMTFYANGVTPLTFSVDFRYRGAQ